MRHCPCQLFEPGRFRRLVGRILVSVACVVHAKRAFHTAEQRSLGRDSILAVSGDKM